MSMWRGREVRVAQISPDARTLFERYGEVVLAVGLGTLSPVTPPVTELADLFNEDRPGLLEWITERRDIEERKADRTEARDVAILVFAAVAAVSSVISI